MPGSHNVGSLFVNISGSTKGLKRALKSASKQIGSFRGGAGLDMFGTKRLKDAQAAYARASTRQSSLQQYQAMGGPRIKSSRKQFAKEMQRTLEEQGRAKTELDAATMARNMRVAMSVFGVSVAAVGAYLRFGLAQGQQSIQRHMQFGAIGPMGGEFIGSQVEALLARIRHAQSPAGSQVLARQAERDRQWEEVGRKWEVVADMWGEIIIGLAKFLTPDHRSNAKMGLGDRYERVKSAFGYGVG